MAKSRLDKYKEKTKTPSSLVTEPIEQPNASKEPNSSDVHSTVDEADYIVVGLEVLESENEFNEFKRLPAEKKIDKLVENIHRVYNLVSTEKPSAKSIIIGWRENVITDSLLNDKSVSNKTKKLFKKKMIELTKQYEKLTIVGGAMLVRKEMPKGHIKQVLQYYSPHDAMKKKEAIQFPKDSQLALHQQQLRSLQTSTDTTFTKVKNTSFVFSSAGIISDSPDSTSSNNPNIGRHGKWMPYKEIYNYDGKLITKNVGFQPGKGRNLSPVIRLQNNFTLGIDICREHALGALKEYAQQNNLAVDLQFVLSDSIPVHTDNIISRCGTIHFDSQRKASLILNPNCINSKSVQLYRVNVLKSSHQPLDPVKPFYPLQFRIFDYIKTTAETTHNDPLIPGILSKVKFQCEKIPTETDLDVNQYIKIAELFNTLHSILIQHKRPEIQAFSKEMMNNLMNILLDFVNTEVSNRVFKLISNINNVNPSTSSNNLANNEIPEVKNNDSQKTDKPEDNLIDLLLSKSYNLAEIQALLNQGADPLLEGSDGFTPYDVVKAQNILDVLPLFQNVLDAKSKQVMSMFKKSNDEPTTTNDIPLPVRASSTNKKNKKHALADDDNMTTKKSLTQSNLSEKSPITTNYDAHHSFFQSSPPATPSSSTLPAKIIKPDKF